jgi:chorismate mutase
LEETTIRWALILNDWLRNKIEKKWFKYDYYCAAIQWDFIDSDEKLLKSLEKRLKIAKDLDSKKCIHNLSEY